MSSSRAEPVGFIPVPSCRHRERESSVNASAKGSLSALLDQRTVGTANSLTVLCGRTDSQTWSIWGQQAFQRASALPDQGIFQSPMHGCEALQGLLEPLDTATGQHERHFVYMIRGICFESLVPSAPSSLSAQSRKHNKPVCNFDFQLS